MPTVGTAKGVAARGGVRIEVHDRPSTRGRRRLREIDTGRRGPGDGPELGRADLASGSRGITGSQKSTRTGAPPPVNAPALALASRAAWYTRQSDASSTERSGPLGLSILRTG
jgi:hypothetical protein